MFRHHHNQPHLQHRAPCRVQGIIFASLFPSPLGVCLGLVALLVSFFFFLQLVGVSFDLRFCFSSPSLLPTPSVFGGFGWDVGFFFASAQEI